MNNIQDWITLLFGATSVSSALGWIAERKKRKADIHTIYMNNEGLALENERKKVDLYQDMLDDLSTRYEKKYNEFEEMHNRKVKLLEDEIAMHKRVIASLKTEIRELKEKLKQYAKDNNTP